MKYIIVSPRIGTPGDVFEPEIVVNLHALLEGGFIKRADGDEETTEEPTPAPTKSAKNKSSKAPTEE